MASAYYRHYQKRTEDGEDVTGYELVEGAKRVKIDARPDYEFFAYFEQRTWPNGTPKGVKTWWICEAQTGCALGTGRFKKAAVQDANDRIKSKTSEFFVGVIEGTIATLGKSPAYA